MNRYKLKKEYPGSPKLGTCLDQETYYHNGIDCDVKDFPEFWEEEVLEYEILSYIGKKTGRIFTKDNRGAFCNTTILSFPSERAIMNNQFYMIHSVKRLSDGEIFTIGDRAIGNDWNFVPVAKDYNILTNIMISDSEMQKDFSSFKVGKVVLRTRISYQTLLEKAKKVRQSLFIAEDGVDIYENDTYHWVASKDHGSIKKFEIFKNVKANWDQHRSDLVHPGVFHNFSNLQKAEEYILMNKPCLSLKDVHDSHKGCVQLPAIALTKLNELVKSRIK